MSAYVQLLKVLEEKKLSKNAIIRETGIDRSTFYQIMRGKRMATSEQLLRILDRIDVSPKTRFEILSEFEREKADAKAYQNRTAVRNFLNSVSSNDDTTKSEVLECPAEIVETVHSATVSKTGSIQIYLAQSLMLRAGIYAQLRREAQASPLTVELLTGVADRCEDFGIIFDNITECLHCLVHHSFEIQVYLAIGGASLSSVGNPYPYYIITDETLLLISADMKKFFMVTDPEQVQTYHSYFDDLVNRATRLVRYNGSREKMFQTLAEKISDAAVKGSKVNLLTPCPCITRTITRAQMEEYMQDETFHRYWNLYHALDLREFTSSRGLSNLLERGVVEESGFHVQIRSEDMPYLRSDLDDRLGNDLFLLNDAVVRISPYWEFMVLGQQEVICMPFSTGSFIVELTDTEIATMFADWCESRMQTANPDLVVKSGA